MESGTDGEEWGLNSVLPGNVLERMRKGAQCEDFGNHVLHQYTFYVFKDDLALGLFLGAIANKVLEIGWA